MPPEIEIIPVLDLLGGQVVRGVAGERESYRPISSRLVDTAEPLAVARAFQDQLGLATLYLADLDAILHDRPALALIEQLAGEGRRLLIDAGLRDAKRAGELIARGAAGVIAGLETLPGPGLLEELLEAVGPDRLLFSLDLLDGRPMVETAGFGTSDPAAVADVAVGLGVTRLIVLDLKGVGGGGGVSTLNLCRTLRDRHGGIELITGGGIRDSGDLADAADAGVDAVLVASALHDGSLAG